MDNLRIKITYDFNILCYLKILLLILLSKIFFKLPPSFLRNTIIFGLFYKHILLNDRK